MECHKKTVLSHATQTHGYSLAGGERRGTRQGLAENTRKRLAGDPHPAWKRGLGALTAPSAFSRLSARHWCATSVGVRLRQWRFDLVVRR